MLKKIILLMAALFVIPITANAIPYIALNVGISKGQWPLNDDTGARTNYGANGAVGGVSLGFGSLLTQSIWLAVEAFGDFSGERTSTKTVHFNSSTADVRMRTRYSYGLSLLPGVLFSRNRGLFYLRLGGLQSRFEVHQSVIPSTSSSSNYSSLQGAAVFGVGLQGALGHSWSVRGEYDRIVYRHFSAFANRISPIDNQLRFGLVYSFI